MSITPPATHSPAALDRFMTIEQRQRALALHEARAVLRTQTSAFSARPLDVVELIEVAQWIIDGEDPWDEVPTGEGANPVAVDEAAKIGPFGIGGVGYMTRGHIHEPKGRAG